MKKALTSSDIRELVSGWQFLVGSRLDQFGRPDSNKLILKLRNRELGTVRLVLDLDGWAYLTKQSLSTESNQGAFINRVRSQIKKSRLDAIEQLNGDRIISFIFSRKDEKIKLVFEFFHKGNAILCDGDKIVMVMRQQKFRHRNLVPKEKYITPPGFNPFNSEFRDYEEKLLKSDRNLGASLTIDCNLGGELSNLICHNLDLDPNSKISKSHIKVIHEQIAKVLNDKIPPAIFLDEEGKNFTVSSYNLSNLSKGPKFSTLDSAIESYVTQIEVPEKIVKNKDDVRISKQKEAIDNYLRDAKELRRIGNLIFSNVEIVEEALVDNEEDEIILKLNGKDIKLLTSKTAQSNASLYFDKAKESERKASRTKEILLEKPRPRSPKVVKQKKLDWFEKYRWFITSEGNIALAGKDAKSNEQVVKKYLKANDRYAHADIHGAPSVVVKSEQGLSPSEISMKEASSFSLAYSKAWGARVASGHSFWVEKESVSKTPNTGEFLAKGAFVIRGKRNWHKNLEIMLAIGLIEYEGNEKLMGGPVESFVGKSKRYIVFKPGFIDRKTVSKKLANVFSEDLSSIEKLLPSGGFEKVNSYGIEIVLE